MIEMTGASLNDLYAQLGRPMDNAKIRISFRKNGANFGRGNEVGCIVNAVGTADDLVPLEFKDTEAAISYIRKILQEHDAYALAHPND